jgi:hypothetical protein
VWKALLVLSQIEARCGNHAGAEALNQEAREFVVGIADRAGVPELRAAFLDLPDVREVLR